MLILTLCASATLRLCDKDIAAAILPQSGPSGAAADS
jgi:hypothetical protein